MTLVGMEMHLAIGQGADRLAVLTDIGDQHHRRVAAHELLGVNLRGRAEFCRETDLILLGQLLIAQQNEEVLVPGIPNVREDIVVDLLPQVDADDLGAQRR